MDLLATVEGRWTGFEIKFSESPSVSRRTRASADALGVDHLFVEKAVKAVGSVDRLVHRSHIFERNVESYRRRAAAEARRAEAGKQADGSEPA